MRGVDLLVFFLFVCLSVSLYAQENTAKPRKGEGIHAFLKRNGRDSKEHYQQFIELNKKKLGKNNSLQLGVTYQLPALSGSKTGAAPSTSTASTQIGKTYREPLFGKKLEEYTIESDRLKGACFYLVSGHGGPDCGAIGKVDGKELHEDEYAYDIMLRLARNLMMEGATVHIIIQDAKDGIRDDKYLANSKRETCMGDPIPLNQKQRLQQRCDKINALSKKSNAKYERAIFIHLDSRSKKQQVDVFFYYAEKSAASKKLANTLRNTFDEHYKKHQPGRGFTGTVTSRSLYVLNNAKPVSVYAELGNIQNSFDQRRFLMSSNRQALANWLARGFIKDYEDYKKQNP